MFYTGPHNIVRVICFRAYVSDPLSSIPILLVEIEQYGQLSGYKMNVNTSEALVLNAHVSPNIKASFNFRWPKKGIMHLGTKILQNLEIYCI